ncbi:MAG: hypothetical protein U1F43_29910 [Myxococcota bacterium]
MDDRQRDRADTVPTSAACGAAPAPNGARARRPYAAPVIESGEAFERVQLASGCNEGVFDCDIPC